ncbi:hypothetical protein ETAA8_67110 [Anatilimnocola aggregata]|uniref:Peptidase C-terminal archaeal/bacterial domain-containing protein n=1 Tax=Anatilimnocola aggregata TaxID=2528021 RepID=A0A517YMV6_9BACT|nr:hypothetical protein [Anatilimnocola aggregata]QDU31552.1 hypothetical protein ETAA8_67110 [Anatilimnocola aggregata]
MLPRKPQPSPTRLVPSLFLGLIWFLGTVFLRVGSSQAEPFIEHLEPPALTRGGTNRLTLVGSELDRAQQLWMSLPAKFFQIKPLESSSDKTVVEVVISPDCPLGLYGLRLATEDGLSNLHLFVIDELTPTRLGDSPLKKFPAAIEGDLVAAEVDRIPLEVVAGQTLSFDILGSRLGTDADPLLTLVNADGKRVLQRDNSPGLFYDCQFSHTFATAGRYTLEVRDSRYLGSPHWRYWLRIGNFPAGRVSLPSTLLPGILTKLELPELPGSQFEVQLPADQPAAGTFVTLKSKPDQTATWLPLLCSTIPAAIESEPNDTRDSPTHITAVPASAQGVLSQRGDVDCFSLYLTKGQKLTFRAETMPLQSAADLELLLIDRTGREVQRMDDVTLPGGALEEASFNFSANDDGLFMLQVRDLSGSGSPAHAYRIEVAPQRPKLQLTSEISAITVPQQSYQRLPFNVVRTDCPGPVELSLVGAPAGVTLEPSTIPEGANTADCRLIARGDAPLGLHTLHVVAKTTVSSPMTGDNEVVAYMEVKPLVDHQLVNPDLIKHALRENQRYLPASVTRSIALQITPPVPFTVELAEPQLTLPRYLQATTTIITTRSDNFAAPISFTVTGGQVGEERQGRKQVFARIPQATAEQLSVPALFVSRSLANELTERIDLNATTKHGDRTIRLHRSFQLAVKPGFEVTLDPPPPTTLPPGSKFTVRLAVQRQPTFQGPVTIEPQRLSGIQLPEELVIAAENNSAEFEVNVPEDLRPGRFRFRFVATGQVGTFQEEPKPKEFDLEVKVPPPEKKPK